jgi:Zn-dependent protease/CBS domain-containing protein
MERGCETSSPHYMNSSFRLGRVAGIEIDAHWSWLLVVALILWSLASGVFPETNPGLSDGTYLAMAAVASVLFFASLTMHELGHALQARRDGIAIEGITLWVFGGVARLRGQLPSAGAELRVAVAGPAVSLALGVVFLLGALVLPLPASVDGVVFWLGQINLYLLVFNLLPALPLDGGRVLRALLWARRRDFVSATRTAGALGRGFGQLLIAAGLLLVIFVGDFGGLWLAFLGWFLLAAAEAELEGAAAREALAGLTVAHLMVRNPVTVDADTTVQAFMNRAFLRTRHTAFPVLYAGRPVGIVSFRDALTLPRIAWPTTFVREIMVSAEEASVDPESPLSEVLPLLAEGNLRRLLVTRDGRLVGLLSWTDVSRVLEVRSALASPEADRRGGRAATRLLRPQDEGRGVPLGR